MATKSGAVWPDGADRRSRRFQPGTLKDEAHHPLREELKALLDSLSLPVATDYEILEAAGFGFVASPCYD